MEVKIQFPEPVAEQVLRLPDRDAFVSSAVVQALARQRALARTDARSDAAGNHGPQPPPLNDRRREDVWRRANREYLQKQFAGQWVVLEGEEIVAHSSDPTEAVVEARTKGVAAPFVFHVEPPRPPGVFRLGL